MNRTEAADALGCSEATISRLRSGDRQPSVRLMQEIRRVLSWSIDDQVTALERGVYGEVFAHKMDKRRMRQRTRRVRVVTD